MTSRRDGSGAIKLIVSWDTAMSAGELSDYSACVVLQVKDGIAYILDVVRERLEYPGSATQDHRSASPLAQCIPATTRC